MICTNCKSAADVKNKAVTEMLHAKCCYPDCYCQHKN